MLESNSVEIQKVVSNLNKNIPIIMLTVDIDFPHAKKATNNGATVLQKPASGQEIISAIESLL